MMIYIDNHLLTNDSLHYPFLKSSINACTLFSTIFAIIVSLVIIDYIIINVLRKHRLKKNSQISLLLTCNTCFAIICSSCTLTLMILSTIGGDLNIKSLKKISDYGCHLRGYLHFVFINSIYLSYCLQAGFRLFRIAFHEYKCLRTIPSFSVYIIIQWLASFLLISPALFARDGYSSLITYLPEEYYCQIPMTNIRGIVFAILSVYLVPLCCIALIYLWIIIYIRRTNKQLLRMVALVRRQNKRDTIIIKRICVVMVALTLLGIPSSLYVISFIITGQLNWAAYRIGWMTISISFALISLSSIYVTPQIYRPIRIRFGYSKAKQNSSYSSSTTNNHDSQRSSKHYIYKQTIVTSIV